MYNFFIFVSFSIRSFFSFPFSFPHSLFLTLLSYLLSPPSLSLPLSLSPSLISPSSLSLHQDTPSDYIGCPVYSVTPDHISVCVRCGSAGVEGLLSCQSCCQPYHWFCVGQPPPTQSSSPSSLPPFTCSRCTSCSVCGLPDEVS